MNPAAVSRKCSLRANLPVTFVAEVPDYTDSAIYRHIFATVSASV
jgi:hypothetical protein